MFRSSMIKKLDGLYRSILLLCNYDLLGQKVEDGKLLNAASVKPRR